MVLYAVALKCLDPVLTIACTQAYRDPFFLSQDPSQRRTESHVRKKFECGTFSDHMVLLRAFQAWQKARADGWERAFCEKHYISIASMEIIEGMRTQLLGQLRASGFVRARGGGDIRDLNCNSENWAVVKAAICAGLYPNVAYIDRAAMKLQLISQNRKSRRSRIRFHYSSSLHPQLNNTMQSVLQAAPTQWLIYEESSWGGGLAQLHCCTSVTPVTLMLFGGPGRFLEEDSHKTVVAATSDDEGGDTSGNQEPVGSVLTFDQNLSFRLDSETADLLLQLRQKWHSLLLRRMRSPIKPLTLSDEMILKTVVAVLTSEEQLLGMQQPPGIGQRPRPMASESVLSCEQEEGDNAGVGEAAPVSLHAGGLQNYRGTFHYIIVRLSSAPHFNQLRLNELWTTSPDKASYLANIIAESGTVYLIFTVEESGTWGGYARLLSHYNQTACFKIQWIRRTQLPFTFTGHLAHGNVPVYMCPHETELEPHVGNSLLKLWETSSAAAARNRKPPPSFCGGQTGMAPQYQGYY